MDLTFTIYDQDQSLRQIKRAQEEVGIDPKRWNPKVLRAAMGSNFHVPVLLSEDLGRDLASLRERARFVQQSAAGARESHVHDMDVVHAAPNYQVPDRD